jgi:hypothetical protein
MPCFNPEPTRQRRTAPGIQAEIIGQPGEQLRRGDGCTRQGATGSQHTITARLL